MSVATKTKSKPKASRPSSTPALRFGSNPKSVQREAFVAQQLDGTHRIVVDHNDPFQSLLVGSFSMSDGVVETPAASARPNTPGSIFANEPVSVPKDPVRISAKIDFELDRIGQLAEQLKDLAGPTLIAPVSTPAAAKPEPQASPLPVEVLENARKSARDAWRAVLLMGAFIVCGITWTSYRLDAADKRVVELLEQLQVQQTSASALRVENQQAFAELSDVKARLKASEFKASKQAY